MNKLLEVGPSMAVAVYAAANIIPPLYDALIQLPFPEGCHQAAEHFYTITGYNILHEHIINKWMFSTFVGYWMISIFATAMDLLPSLFLKLKTQGNRSYFTVTEWLEAVSLSMFNLLGSSWLFIIPVTMIWKPTMVESDEWVWQTEVPKALFHVVCIDIWFYATHWVLHQPMFYAPIHKLHHRFKAPTAVACMYAHPIEFVVGNLTGVVLGPILTGCHPFTAYFWLCFSLMSTGGSHSGYFFLGAEEHDDHHLHFNYNFGVSGLMDTLCGTHFVGSKKWKSLQEAKAAKAH